ncbi:MAG: hypothetical protein GY868_19315 [Deltaproteobacteria bacterium]|nr:hypothetical protein [Deltaproteobacteria bacterium]
MTYQEFLKKFVAFEAHYNEDLSQMGRCILDLRANTADKNCKITAIHDDFVQIHVYHGRESLAVPYALLTVRFDEC